MIEIIHGLVLADSGPAMNLTFITAPEKLLCVADEGDSSSAAWARFKAHHSALLLVKRGANVVGGLTPEHFRDVMRGSLPKPLSCLPMKHICVLSYRAKLSDILHEFDATDVDAVILADGEKMVSAVVRPPS
jgi:hypothetical protein